MLEISLDEVHNMYIHQNVEYYKTTASSRIPFCDFVEKELKTILFIKYGSIANTYRII